MKLLPQPSARFVAPPRRLGGRKENGRKKRAHRQYPGREGFVQVGIELGGKHLLLRIGVARDGSDPPKASWPSSIIISPDQRECTQHAVVSFAFLCAGRWRPGTRLTNGVITMSLPGTSPPLQSLVGPMARQLCCWVGGSSLGNRARHVVVAAQMAPPACIPCLGIAEKDARKSHFRCHRNARRPPVFHRNTRGALAPMGGIQRATRDFPRCSRGSARSDNSFLSTNSHALRPSSLNVPSPSKAHVCGFRPRSGCFVCAGLGWSQGMPRAGSLLQDVYPTQ
jgi:hypothetical protein